MAPKPGEAELMAADEGTSDAGWRRNSVRCETTTDHQAPHSAGCSPSPDSVVVDIASVAQRHDDDQEHVVSDGVDNPVIADANAQTVPAPKRS